MTLFLISYEFMKMGLLAIGGGWATIPFLYHLIEQYAWYSADDLAQMIAISSITPGPIGLNMATYVGFKSAGFLGALLATVSIMVPSFFIVIGAFKFLKKFSENTYVKTTLRMLKPTVCAMIFMVFIRLFSQNIIINNDFSVFAFKNIQEHFDILGLGFLLSLIIVHITLKLKPLYYLVIGGVFGFLIYFKNIILN